MIQIIPMSDEFFYWDPEAICTYPDLNGAEAEWFVDNEHKVTGHKLSSVPDSSEVIYAW